LPDLDGLLEDLEASLAELVEAAGSAEGSDVGEAGAPKRRQQTQAEQQV
jgi:hypothetical protein